jgi:hypothetical protein
MCISFCCSSLRRRYYTGSIRLCTRVRFTGDAGAVCWFAACCPVVGLLRLLNQGRTTQETVESREEDTRLSLGALVVLL